MNAHASQVIGRITGQWRAAPPVTVVSWPQDLPVKGAPSDVRGMYKDGSTWIVANTQSQSKVGETLAHEALGHHSMREMLGSGWKSFMHALNDGARSGDAKLSGVRDYVREIYVNNNGECDLSTDQIGDEVAAAVTEYRFDSQSGRLVVDQPARKLARAAVGHLSREVLLMDRPASFCELEGTLLAAEHRLRFGGAFWGVAFQIKRLYASAMTKPWNPNKAPMSLAESQSLLKLEKARVQSIAEWKFMGLMLLVFIGVIGLLWGAGSFLIDLFNGFRH